MIEKKIIAIEGNIGAGKSTLVNMIKEKYPDDVEVIYEPVDIWCSFGSLLDPQNEGLLTKFYNDPSKYAYPFQILVFASHISVMVRRIRASPKKVIILDRCPHAAFLVFAKVLFEEGKLDVTQYQTLLFLLDMYEDIIESNGYKVAQHIYLRTTPENCYDRIHHRNRDGEAGNVDIDYLRKLQEKYDEWLLEKPNTQILDGNINIRQYPAAFDNFIDSLTDI